MLVPDCGVVFTGDLVQERMFPIFPWFPPDDVDIDAANWVRVLARLGAEEPRIVVPGHGIQAGPEIIRMVRDYMIDLGQRVRSRRDKGEDLRSRAGCGQKLGIRPAGAGRRSEELSYGHRTRPPLPVTMSVGWLVDATATGVVPSVGARAPVNANSTGLGPAPASGRPENHVAGPIRTDCANVSLRIVRVRDVERRELEKAGAPIGIRTRSRTMSNA